MSESEPSLSDLPVPVDPNNSEAAEPAAFSTLDDSTGRDAQSRSSLGDRLPRYVRLTWLKSSRAWRSFLRDQVTPVRLASHIALLLMAVTVIVLSRVELPRWDIVRVAPLQAEDIGILPEPAFDQQPVGGSPLQEGGVLLRAPVPFTEIPDRPRTGVITYTVQADDTILGIAEKFNLNPTTFLWANQEDPKQPFWMEVGQVMAILPIDGVLHTAKDGDTIEKIAKLYKVTADQIVAYEPNQLANADAPLTAGQVIIVPDGDKTPPEEVVSVPAPGPRGGNSSSGPAAPWRANGFVWPAYGPITQRFYRGVHPAIDIGARMGSGAYAADEGSVIEAGWSSVGFGKHVYISHPDGYVTLYAHLSRIDVSVGDYVARGQQIGAVGSTGRSTGPHLHFEVHLGGRAYNPLVYLQ